MLVLESAAGVMMFISKSVLLQGYASLVSNKVYNFLDCKHLNLGFLMLISWNFVFKSNITYDKKNIRVPFEIVL